jgi:hypothetical protein
MQDRMNIPLWFNADLLSGPGGGEPVFDPKAFLADCTSAFPSATLSLGWTTGSAGSYTADTLRPMLALLEGQAVTGPVTFPLRAALVTQSGPAISQFLLEVANLGQFPWSLTIWTGASDTVDRAKLMDFVELVGRDRVYLDVPWAHSSGSAVCGGQTSLALLSALTCLAVML